MSVRIATTALFLSLAVPSTRTHAQRFDASSMRDIMTEWKQDNDYNAMTQAQKTESDKGDEARMEAQQKRADAYEKCTNGAMTPDAMMAMSQQMQKRMMELAGDPDMATKAAAEQQKALKDIVTKKCGPAVKAPTAPHMGSMTREPIITYLRIRKEKGPKAAADAISATPEEVKAIEDNLVELTALAAAEMKAGGGKF